MSESHFVRPIDVVRAEKKMSLPEQVKLLRAALTDCEWAIGGYVEHEDLDASEPCPNEELCAAELCGLSGCLVDRIRNVRAALTATAPADKDNGI
jgi:hypothetical protein